MLTRETAGKIAVALSALTWEPDDDPPTDEMIGHVALLMVHWSHVSSSVPTIEIGLWIGNGWTAPDGDASRGNVFDSLVGPIRCVEARCWLTGGGVAETEAGGAG